MNKILHYFNFFSYKYSFDTQKRTNSHITVLLTIIKDKNALLIVYIRADKQVGGMYT